MTTESKSKLSPDAKIAMRAYLQRAEVRLSTMHRIAGVFLNGAGLLFLLPVFLRDAFTAVFNIIFEQTDGDTTIIMLVLLFITLALPLWSFYLLISDLIYFYFTPYHPGVKETYFHPRFILTGINFSEDESSNAKSAIIAAQQDVQMLRFIVPADARDREYFQALIDATKNQIIPEARRAIIPHTEPRIEQDVTYYYATLGLTATIDRTLVDEVAKMEMSLARHALNLRHLVLRYAKALLFFIVTTLILVVGVAILVQPTLDKSHLTTQYILSTMFLAWAFLTPLVVTQPIRWIYRFAEKSMYRIRTDRQLVVFEQTVVGFSVFVFCVALWKTNIYGYLPANYASLLTVAASGAFATYWYLKTTSKPTRLPEPSEDKSQNQDVSDPQEDMHQQTSNPKPLAANIRWDLPQISHAMDDAFSLKELRVLSFDFSFDLDDKPGNTKSEKVREIVKHFEGRRQVHILIERLSVERPNYDWQAMRK